MTSSRLALLVAHVAGVAACARDRAGGDPSEYRNLVVAAPFVGTFAVKAEEHKNAVLMAVERFERAGGRPDRPIRVVFSDTSGDAMAATAALTATLDDLTVGETIYLDGIITSSTGTMMAAVPFALRHQVPHIEVSSGSGFDELDAASRASLATPGVAERFFATRPLCLPEPEFSADFVVAQRAAGPGWTRVAIIHNGATHDLMHADTFRTEMAERITGFTPVVDINLKTSGLSYAQAIAAAQSAPGGAADVIYFHITGDGNNINFFKAARDANFAGKLVTCGMSRIQEVLRLGDPDVAPYLADNQRLYFQMRGVLPGAELDRFQDDLLAYTEKGGEVDVFSASAFDAGMLFVLAQQRSTATGQPVAAAIVDVATGEGTNQLVVGPDGVSPDVIDRLAAGEDINYDGASSRLELTLSHPTAPNGHEHFGYMTQGSYYVEQVVREGADGYGFRALAAPYEEM